MCIGCTFLIRPLRIGPEIRVFVLLFASCFDGQFRHSTIKGYANHAAVIGLLLEDGAYLAAPVDHRADPGRTLGCQIAELDATGAIDRHGARIGRVFGFAVKLDWLAGLAQGKFEAPGRAAFVGVLRADDGEA